MTAIVWCVSDHGPDNFALLPVIGDPLSRPVIKRDLNFSSVALVGSDVNYPGYREIENITFDLKEMPKGTSGREQGNVPTGLSGLLDWMKLREGEGGDRVGIKRTIWSIITLHHCTQNKYLVTLALEFQWYVFRAACEMFALFAVTSK